MTELEKLKAENKELRKEQDSMFLLLDMTLCAVKKWGMEHGLIFDTVDNDIMPNADINSVKNKILDILVSLEKSETT